jgi:hypothetical protein
MGWDGGADVLESMARRLRSNGTAEAARRAAYRATIPSLEERDWNDHQDVLGLDPVLDEVIYELQGDGFGMEAYGRSMSHVTPAKWHMGRYYFSDDPRYHEVSDGSGAVADHEARYPKSARTT